MKENGKNVISITKHLIMFTVLLSREHAESLFSFACEFGIKIINL